MACGPGVAFVFVRLEGRYLGSGCLCFGASDAAYRPRPRELVNAIVARTTGSGKANTRHERGPKVTRAQVDLFIAERRGGLDRLDDAAVEAMTRAALASADKDRSIREAQALRKKRNIPTGPSVRRHT